MSTLDTRLPRASAAVRKMNPGLWHAEKIRADIIRDAIGEPKKRIRQRTDKRSELEIRFGGYLKAFAPSAIIHEQFPLRIGNGCNYYVDFLTAEQIESGGYAVAAYEVKGPFSRAAGIVKLKASAMLHRWIKFYLVSADDDGVFRMEDVLS